MSQLFALLGLVILAVLVGALMVRAIGGNITLLDDWKQAARWYSTWGLIGVGMLPDLWNTAVAHGYVSWDAVPGAFGNALKFSVLAVFVVSKIKQGGSAPPLPDFGKRDGEA